MEGRSSAISLCEQIRKRQVVNLTVGPRGRRVSVGLPGTRLFLTQQSASPSTLGAGHRIALAIMALFGAAMLVWAIAAAPH